MGIMTPRIPIGFNVFPKFQAPTGTDRRAWATKIRFDLAGRVRDDGGR